MLRAAVIGTGYLGAFHAEKYFRSKNAELVAIVDLVEDRAREIAKKFGAIPLTDYHDLRYHKIDVVSVASSTRTHRSIAGWCLENELDVLVEKPMCVTTSEARELIDLAEKHSRVLQVGHLERFNPAFQAIRSSLKNPRFFEVRRIAQFKGRGHDVDVVLDLMIHDIDLVCHLIQQPVISVEAVGVPVLTSSVDIANARIRFAGGAVANVTASRAAFKSERTVRIFQPDLYISIDFEKKRLKLCQKSGGYDIMGFPKISVEERAVEERDALADEIESFLSSCATRSIPVVTGEDGLKALELAETVRASVLESAVKEDGLQWAV